MHFLFDVLITFKIISPIPIMFEMQKMKCNDSNYTYNLVKWSHMGQCVLVCCLDTKPALIKWADV